MARKLKTYVTNLGFFELAIAAPSMKAALEAWGMTHNAFQHGFAEQTDAPAIVAQTTAKPGIVLKRAVGSNGAFTEDPDLPERLPAIRPTAAIKTKAPPKAAKPKKPSGAKSDPAAIISFEKARRAREKQRAREDAAREREISVRRAATGKAERALARALEAHEQTLRGIDRDRDKVDRRADAEARRWKAEKEKLKSAIDRARK